MRNNIKQYQKKLLQSIENLEIDSIEQIANIFLKARKKVR